MRCTRSCSISSKLAEAGQGGLIGDDVDTVVLCI